MIYAQSLSGGAFSAIAEAFYDFGKSSVQTDVAEENLATAGIYGGVIQASGEDAEARLPAYQRAQALLSSARSAGKNPLMLTAIIGGALVLAVVVLSKK